MPVYQLPVYPLIGQFSQFTHHMKDIAKESKRVKMACVSHARRFDETEFNAVLDNCLRDFPRVKVLRKEQKARLLNLARGKDVFSILPTGFGKSLIFQLFPRVSSALCSSSEVKPLSTIIVVSPLVSVMRD